MTGRPRIGILMDVGHPDEQRKMLELSTDYPGSVARAGGLPVLLPMTGDPILREEMLSLVDGLLVPGGADLDPTLYGQTLHEKTKLVDQERQAFDFAMLSLAEQRRMPTLGICLGSQSMNVHRRGTMHQHLPDVRDNGGAEMLTHSRKGDRTNFHTVQVRAGTALAGAVGAGSVEVNSRHHQGFAKLGHGFIETAIAPDGLVEAFEDPTLPFWMGVQWHPENLAGSPHEGLFRALVAAAGKYRDRAW